MQVLGLVQSVHVCEYTIMKVVAIEELHSSLSECIAVVKNGEDLVFTQGGKPVARMTAENSPGKEIAPEDEYEAHLRQLEKEGVIRLGTGKLPDDFWSRPLPKLKNGTLLDALLEERAEGR